MLFEEVKAVERSQSFQDFIETLQEKKDELTAAQGALDDFNALFTAITNAKDATELSTAIDALKGDEGVAKRINQLTSPVNSISSSIDGIKNAMRDMEIAAKADTNVPEEEEAQFTTEIGKL